MPALDLEVKEAVGLVVDKAVLSPKYLSRGGLAQAWGSTQPDQFA